MEVPCRKCGKMIELPSLKISFRATCPHCLSYLHSCLNCKNHQVGLSNECKIPGTDPIRDREGGNFCEEFVFQEGKGGKSAPTKEDVLKRLFGDQG